MQHSRCSLTSDTTEGRSPPCCCWLLYCWCKTGWLWSSWPSGHTAAQRLYYSVPRLTERVQMGGEAYRNTTETQRGSSSGSYKAIHQTAHPMLHQLAPNGGLSLFCTTAVIQSTLHQSRAEPLRQMVQTLLGNKSSSLFPTHFISKR